MKAPLVSRQPARRPRQRGAATWALAWAVATSAGTSAAQVHTTDAGVASPALPSVQLRADWRQRERGEELHLTTKAVWSPTPKVETALVVPWISRRGRFEGPGGDLHSDRQGLGDVQVLGKWALVRDDEVMQSDRVSLLFGASLPTGEHDASVGATLIPRREQLGMGAFGGGLGAGVTLVRDRHRCAAALMAWQFGNSDGFEPGAEVRLDLAWWYRLSPAEFAGHGHDLGHETEWRVAVELLSAWRADDRGVTTRPDNGGPSSELSLGLQCNQSSALRIETAVRAPLLDEVDAAFGGDRIAITFSLRWFF